MVARGFACTRRPSWWRRPYTIGTPLAALPQVRRGRPARASRRAEPRRSPGMTCFVGSPIGPARPLPRSSRSGIEYLATTPFVLVSKRSELVRISSAARPTGAAGSTDSVPNTSPSSILPAAPQFQRYGMLRFGRGIMAGLQAGQPVQAEFARTRQDEPIAQLGPARGRLVRDRRSRAGARSARRRYVRVADRSRQRRFRPAAAARSPRSGDLPSSPEHVG